MNNRPDLVTLTVFVGNIVAYNEVIARDQVNGELILVRAKYREYVDNMDYVVSDFHPSLVVTRDMAYV